MEKEGGHMCERSGDGSEVDRGRGKREQRQLVGGGNPYPWRVPSFLCWRIITFSSRHGS